MTDRIGRCCNVDIKISEYLQHLQSFHAWDDFLLCTFCKKFTGEVGEICAHFVEVHEPEIRSQKIKGNGRKRKLTDSNSDQSPFAPKVIFDASKYSDGSDDDFAIATGIAAFYPELPESEYGIRTSEDAFDDENKNEIAIDFGMTSSPSDDNADNNNDWMNSETIEVERGRGRRYRWDAEDKREKPAFWLTLYQIDPSEANFDIGSWIENVLGKKDGVSEINVAHNFFPFQQLSWDRAFGCGYRNLQMLAHCMNHDERYANLIPQVPHFTEIQRDIQSAVDNGYSLPDCPKIGSCEWIGPDEIAAYLWQNKIRGHIFDVQLKSADGQLHIEVLTNFVYNYYKLTENPFTIFFQYQGHSCSIIGYVVLNGKKCILLFDPQTDVKTLLKALRSSNVDLLDQLLREDEKDRKSSRLHHSIFQMASVRGLIRNDQERDFYKDINIGINRHILTAEQSLPEDYFVNDEIRLRRNSGS